MKINIINKSNYPLRYETGGAAGLDLRANITDGKLVHPGERILIPTGIYMELPVDLHADIRPRSGLALKEGVTVLNSPGTIDSDYRGEIGVILINNGVRAITITPDMRIAQMVICKHELPEFKEVNELTDTDRGEDGFGSTGVK